jgi:D-xylose transport system ATP-binding protein
MRHIHKRFGRVEALHDVHFDVHAGEVVGLVGDNGAGKSTLIKALSGVQPADSGEILFAGRPVKIARPKDAAELGIAAVYQDLALCDNLDVVANLFLGREETGRLAGLDELAMERTTLDLLESLSVGGLGDVHRPVGSMSGGQRQSVAISRAMLGQARVIILDEPTAALGVVQTEQVLGLVGRLRDRGMGVIIISHNLANVFSVADRIAVLRLGRNAGTFAAEQVNRQSVIAAITGVEGDIAPAQRQVA